ncbi:hypothetical protein BaRGS_00033857 [Batillaria attramentaria]|uniref:Ig-like domain-containing protein n=1 Tax=Batillaria attramentaria TaxID=370345 RepID=A0ABD0JKB5_9CAEN
MLVGVFPASVLLLCLAVFAQAQQVDVPRQPPYIMEPTTRSQKFVKAGEDVILQCNAEGQPDVVYEWLRNDNTITSDVIAYDANTGTLGIKGITQREEGFFNCKAKNTYQGQEAVAISPKIEVRIARVGDFPRDDGSQKTFTFTEGQYAKLPCAENLPVYYGPITFKWYTPKFGTLHEVIPDERKFIDQEGSLHFAYIERGDENVDGNREYQCAMSNTIQGLITLGGEKQVFVNSAVPESKPSAEYGSSGDLLTVERNNDAILECVFSGYQNADIKVPTVTWLDNENKPITLSSKYSIENYGRRLIIRNVIQSDEKTYFCQGKNDLGTATKGLILNVTSSPIWVEPLQSITVPEGQNAELRCYSRSAVGEVPPGPPEWHKNGVRMESGTDATKYKFSDGNRKMTVMYPNKANDIACFQCYVENSVGREFSNGCLNVILPITVTVQPDDLVQVVSKGDIVNLTVVATSDVLTPTKYRWVFKNVTYESNEAPPYVTYDPVTQLAFINTSMLTEEEFAEIDGVYGREIYHQYQSVFVDVEVSREEAPPDYPSPEDNGFPLAVWFIIPVLILILVVAGVVVWRRRKTAKRQSQSTTGSVSVTAMREDAGSDFEVAIGSVAAPDNESQVDEDEYHHYTTIDEPTEANEPPGTVDDFDYIEPRLNPPREEAEGSSGYYWPLRTPHSGVQESSQNSEYTRMGSSETTNASEVRSRPEKNSDYTSLKC